MTHNSNKSKTNRNIKTKKMPRSKPKFESRVLSHDDIIEKEDFDNISSDLRDTDNDIMEEKEEEDILDDRDYGDEEQNETGEDQDIEYDIGGDSDEGCLYKFAKKISSDSEDDEDDELVFEDEIETKTNFIVDNEDRETKPILTKYERVRILGDRAKQLSLGAKPMLLNVENMNPKEIAKLELERGVIPFIIEKILPNGQRERWKVSELKIVN